MPGAVAFIMMVGDVEVQRTAELAGRRRCPHGRSRSATGCWARSGGAEGAGISPCKGFSALLYLLFPRGWARASVAQSAELLICNQEVAGSTPAASSAGAAERPWSVVIGEGIRARGEAATNGQMAERPMASDCKSDGLVPTQVRILLCPFETAGVAQLAERRLSKPHVVGSIPITRSLGEIRHGTDGCQALPAMWRGEGAGGL